MDQRIFQPGIIGLKEGLLTIPLEKRLSYDPGKNLFFVNFEGFQVNSMDTVNAIDTIVRQMIAPLGKKVFTIVNYDNFTIHPDLVDAYTDMVKKLADDCYIGVTRYTTSTFLRMKLGEALSRRNVAPHIYESDNEAKRALNKMT